MPQDVIYIARSRLHRNRANLIQTLHTAAAFGAVGVQVRLYLPPWSRRIVVPARLDELGIRAALDLRWSRFLHSRWRLFGFRPFIVAHRAELRGAGALYTRAPEVSAAFASAGLVHHLEVHEIGHLRTMGLLGHVVRWHRSGLINWLVPISHAAAADLREAGAAAERIHVSPSGADLDGYRDVEPFDVNRLDHPRILYVGRISRDRGLAIFEALAERGVGAITLMGEQEDVVKPSPYLHVEPFVPHRDVPGWYGRADMVLLPYQPELRHAASLSPMKLFEAMAAGRPIIASDLRPLREILEHEKTALMVRPDRVEAWVTAIQTLRHDRALAARLASGAKALASRFSWRERALGIARALGWHRGENRGDDGD
ncbi:MAG TPA: glycosyltransferase family 4 protein [Syntrophobacteria bacterium]|nr:glycosyltransferase family 4 protein [Syntrophobacteria bacterium]